MDAFSSTGWAQYSLWQIYWFFLASSSECETAVSTNVFIILTVFAEWQLKFADWRFKIPSSVFEPLDSFVGPTDLIFIIFKLHGNLFTFLMRPPIYCTLSSWKPSYCRMSRWQPSEKKWTWSADDEVHIIKNEVYFLLETNCYFNLSKLMLSVHN